MYLYSVGEKSSVVRVNRPARTRITYERVRCRVNHRSAPSSYKKCPTLSLTKATSSGADRLRDGAGSAVPTYAITFLHLSERLSRRGRSQGRTVGLAIGAVRLAAAARCDGTIAPSAACGPTTKMTMDLRTSIQRLVARHAHGTAAIFGHTISSRVLLTEHELMRVAADRTGRANRLDDKVSEGSRLEIARKPPGSALRLVRRHNDYDSLAVSG